ncbi:MAG TPA: ATP-grasp domain-containing protein [Candidatus Bathyarchaeota archaeon]|nr:ATP-grasp domain-containing protein [Candidatus Bathyarchaeota archaeon]
MNNKKYILVVSANFRKAYPIIKSVAKMKFKVIAAFYNWRSPIFSRYVNKRHIIANPYTDKYKYICQILSIVHLYKPVMIIPVGFIDNIILARYKSLIPDDTIIPIPEYNTIIAASDKFKLIELCERIGVKCPKTLRPTENTLGKILEKIGLPLVVKGTSDASSPQYAFTVEQLEKIMKNRNKENLILQEFIAGVGCGYFVLAKDGHALVEYTHTRVIEAKPSGGPSIVARIDNNPKIMKIGRKIVEKLKWTGVLMAEFKKDYETGEHYLIELNPKFWGSLELAVSKGIDFPKYLIEAFLYNRVPRSKISENGYFAWILAGLHYLKSNPKVWFKILKYGLRNGTFSSDIHFTDPTELTYSLTTRLINLILGEYGTPYPKDQYASNINALAKTIISRNIKSIIFDLDGTIINLKIDWGRVKKDLLEQGLITPWSSIMVKLYQLRQRNLNGYYKLSSIIEAYEAEALKEIKYNSEIQRQFSKLRSLGFKLAVVSKQTKNIITSALQKLGIQKYFEAVIGREYSMSRREQAIMAIKMLRTPYNSTILAGDTINDAASAAKLSITPVGISANTYRLQQFTELGIPCFSKIESFIQFILKLKGEI